MVQATTESNPPSSRWKILSKSVGDIFENGLLLLMTGSPVMSVKSAMSELQECVGKVYDEQVVNCVDGPASTIAASLLVLSDYRTWIWPPDVEIAGDVILDVITRRLKPKVRDDQCGEDEKPSSE